MTSILQYSPGQKATLFFETFDGYGARADGYFIPYFTRIILPGLLLAGGFPQNMVQLDVGLYFFQFTLPSGAASVGSYLADLTYNDPADGYNKQTAFQVICTAPYGSYSATVG